MKQKYEILRDDDNKRLVIPWVRQTTSDGKEVIYRTTDTNQTEWLQEFEKPEVMASSTVMAA